MTDPEQPREPDEQPGDDDGQRAVVDAAKLREGYIVPPSDRTIRNIIARGQVIE